MTNSDGAKEAEIEKYKAMIRNANNTYQDTTARSQEFVSPPSSPKRKVSGNSPHKWGKPVSPEQHRPDDWLGTPSSGGRRSYRVKSSTLPKSLPTVDLDNDSAIGSTNSTTSSRTKTDSRNGTKDVVKDEESWSPSKLRRHLSVGPGSASSLNADAAANDVRRLERRSSAQPILATPSPGTLGRKKFVPSRGISEGGKPGVPSMFAASISPRTPSFKKSPKAPTLPDPKSYLAMRGNGPLSDVPTAFRSSLNKGISVTAKSEILSKYALSPGPALARPRKFSSAYAKSSPYMDAKNSLKSRSVTAKPGGANSAEAENVTLTQRRPRSASHSDTGTETQSPLTAARMRVSMEGGSSHLGSSSLSPKSSKPKVRKQPRSPKRGGEGNSPKPPLSPKRASTPMDLNEIPGLPLDASPEPTAALKKRHSDGTPPPATSYAKEQEQEQSPILKREKIDKEKFLSSFVSFEDKEGPPISSDPLKSWTPKSKAKAKKAASMYSREAPDLYGQSSSSKPLKKKKTPSRSQSVRTQPVRSVSPSRNSRRNYSISPLAKQRDSAIASSSNHNSVDGSSNWHELNDLQTIIAHLRKVQLPDISKVKRKGADKSDDQASEILAIIRSLRRVETKNAVTNNNNAGDKHGSETITSTMADLKRAGILKVKIMDIELGMLEDAQMRLKKVHHRLDDREYTYGQMTTVLAKLKKATTTPTSDFLPLVEDAIVRLQKMIPDLHGEDKEEAEGVVTNLRGVAAKMLEREEGELAGVIRSFDDHSRLAYPDGDGSGSADELARVIANLKSLCKPDGRRLRLGANLSADDADFLAHAIDRLRKVKMTDREADECAELIRNLRKVGDRGAQHAAIANLGKSMSSPEKGNEIEAVLKGLRKLSLSDHDWDELANEVAAFNRGTRGAPSSEVSDVISGLRKVKMNKKEAKEVAGIVYNLRKINRDQGKLSPEDEEREMIKLRNVLPDGTDEELFDTILNLQEADLDENAVTDLVDAVVDLGDKSPIGSQTGLVMADLVMPELPGPPLVGDGASEEMVINVPKGDSGPNENLGETLHWDRGVSLRGKNGNGNDSDYEEASTSSEEEEGDDDDDDNSQEDGMEIWIEFSTASGKKKKKKREKTLDWDRTRRRKKEGSSKEASVLSDDNKTQNAEGEGMSTGENAAPDGENLKWGRSRKGKKGDGDDSDFEEGSVSSAEGNAASGKGKKGKRTKNTKKKNTEGVDHESGSDVGDDEGSLELMGEDGRELELSRLSGSGNGDKKFHYSCPVVYEPDRLGNQALPEPEEKKKKIVFNQKPKWKHKKHNMTVVGEKRWRFQENFGADEVLFSPLSRDQYDRRKKISESIFANLGDTLPFGDNKEEELGRSYTSMDVQEFMDRKERTGRRSKVVTATDRG